METKLELLNQFKNSDMKKIYQTEQAINIAPTDTTQVDFVIESLNTN